MPLACRLRNTAKIMPARAILSLTNFLSRGRRLADSHRRSLIQTDLADSNTRQPFRSCFLSSITPRLPDSANRPGGPHSGGIEARMCPAPPVGTQTSSPLPCSLLAGLAASSTWATLPHYSVSITWPTSPGTGHHSGSCSGSRVSLDLHP